jgi:predicted dehydrogenase
MIGLGIRGSLPAGAPLRPQQRHATVAAICDAYTGNLAKAGAASQTLGGNTPQAYADYRDLLRDKSIDAVFIATPEHLHAAMLIDALAGRQARVLREAAGPHHRGRRADSACRRKHQTGGPGGHAESQ